MENSADRRQTWIPAPTRGALVALAWGSVPGLPIVILIARMASVNAGIVTAFFVIPVASVLALFGIVPAAAATKLPKGMPPTRSLWWSYAGFGIWFAGCLVGLGLNISDSTGVEDYSAPLRRLIPSDLEMAVAGWLFAIAFVGLIFSTGSTTRIIMRLRDERKGRR